MEWTVYHTISSDNATADSNGNFFLFDHAQDLLKEKLENSDVVVCSASVFKQGMDKGVFPKEGIFFVVLKDGTEFENLSKESVWETDLNIKGVRREIKIQGFKNVLCITEDETLQAVIKSKIAKKCELVTMQNITGGVKNIGESVFKMFGKWNEDIKDLGNGTAVHLYQL